MSALSEINSLREHLKPVAIINLTRMGDLLMTVPMVRAMKRKYPEKELHLFVVEGFQQIARTMPVDKVIPVKFNELASLAVFGNDRQKGLDLIAAFNEFKRIINSYTSTKYEYIYNITHTNVTALLSSIMEGDVKGGIYVDSQGYRRIAGKWAKYFFAGNLNRTLNPFHLVDVNNGFLGLKRSEYRSEDISIDMNLESTDLIDEIFLNSEKTIVIQCGASKADKRWDSRKFGEVARQLISAKKATVIFVGTEEEAVLAEEANEVTGNRGFVLSGKTTLPELATVLKRADVLVTNDTGTMHLAQAMGTESVVITLGTAVSDETGPYGVGNVILEPSVSCYPCSFHVQCPHYNCHKMIESDLVAEIAWDMANSRLKKRYVNNGKSNVWRTDFDKDGYWRKYPLSRIEGVSNSVVREIYREILKSDLGKKKLELENISLVIENKYGINEGEFITSAFKELLDEDKEIKHNIYELLKLSENIKSLSKSLSDNSLEKMGRCAKELLGKSNNFFEKNLRHPILRPILLLARFDQENISDNDLNEQVEETVLMYERLKNNYNNLIKGMRLVTQNVNSKIRCNNSGKKELARKRFTSENSTVIVLKSEYYLQREIVNALKKLGHNVIEINYQEENNVIEKLLLSSTKADMLLTINHLGFDKDGIICELLDRIKMPYVSWYVDRPGFILLDNKLSTSEYHYVFTWEKKTIEELTDYGFKNVYYLPLATDPDLFVRRSNRHLSGEVRFVGNSMVYPAKEWAARINGNKSILEEMVKELLNKKQDPVVLANKFVGSENKRRRLELASAASLAAGREKRKMIAELVRKYDGSVYGDPGWQETAPALRWNPKVDYYKELADVYNGSIHINDTSYQMLTAVNQRVFDVPISGGILITDNQDDIRDMFDEENEIISYATIEELDDKVKYIKSNIEKATYVSVQARDRILKNHTYVHRLKEMISIVRKETKTSL